MSGSNRWSVDVVTAREGAMAAAGNSNRSTRVRAFLALCGELGEVANAYACPHGAARALVQIAARTYAAELKGA
ncbi:hypothetical protein [Streptomyces afghaniensis]|uniref:hypothetical protein n=1 Tax=Streptomyces afghaniensis TaxID=66865 RepID=UPI0027891865|nr:hypothetical protein [Streptomyces afghaniensis]MDQ1016715.1 hypothetical protein [Streptomyces afghaniensis]